MRRSRPSGSPCSGFRWSRGYEAVKPYLEAAARNHSVEPALVIAVAAAESAPGVNAAAQADAHLPFRSGRAFSASVLGTELLVKGAPEVVLDACKNAGAASVLNRFLQRATSSWGRAPRRPRRRRGLSHTRAGRQATARPRRRLRRSLPHAPRPRWPLPRVVKLAKLRRLETAVSGAGRSCDGMQYETDPIRKSVRCTPPTAQAYNSRSIPANSFSDSAVRCLLSREH